eukprot:TRINITY_DN74987_c0_g1_i1.p1 TRINITY_DN74987_c0_g1~~TRINITY_DN74987_c0_g1_i1.p1  ORF type:complete len:325 (-),score=39.50 TRINITY_DN74987_c0_g1_i1:282-1256(-)
MLNILATSVSGGATEVVDLSQQKDGERKNERRRRPLASARVRGAICCGCAAACVLGGFLILFLWSAGWCSSLLNRDVSEGLAKYAQPLPGKVLFIGGDSSLDFWDGDCVAERRDAPCPYDTFLILRAWTDLETVLDDAVYNIGVTTTLIGKWAASVDAIMEKYQPRTIVLSSGMTDMQIGDGCGLSPFTPHGSSVEETSRELKDLIYKLVFHQNKTDHRVFLLGTVPEPLNEHLHDKYRALNNNSKTLALELANSRERPPLVYIDSFESFAAVGCGNTCFNQDQVHLSVTAYGFWAMWLRLALTAQGEDRRCVIWQNEVCMARA